AGGCESGWVERAGVRGDHSPWRDRLRMLARYVGELWVFKPIVGERTRADVDPVRNRVPSVDGPDRRVIELDVLGAELSDRPSIVTIPSIKPPVRKFIEKERIQLEGGFVRHGPSISVIDLRRTGRGGARTPRRSRHSGFARRSCRRCAGCGSPPSWRRCRGS